MGNFKGRTSYLWTTDTQLGPQKYDRAQANVLLPIINHCWGLVCDIYSNTEYNHNVIHYNLQVMSVFIIVVSITFLED